jgi:DNA polymerase-1
MEERTPRLLLVDGNALVHRAYHALPPLTVKSSGEIVNAVFGFSSMLIKAINDLKPSHSAVAFDKRGPTFRHELYDQYKAHRPAMPDDLASQLGRVREVVKSFRIPIFELQGFEADDILGSLSLQASQKELDTVILTGDADMMQLVSERIKVFYPRPGGSFSDAILYDAQTVEERYGVKPPQIADLKALKGDPSDNIPGVPGVGDKTALKLVLQFASVENLVNHLEEVEPLKLRERIRENLDALKRSHELATIVRSAPVTLDFDECCQMSRYDRAKVVEMFRELGFNSLLNKLPPSENEVAAAPATPPVEFKKLETRYQTITSAAELETLAARLADSDTLAFSSEGSLPNPTSAEVVGVTVSPAEGEAYYIPARPPGSLAAGQIPLAEIVRCLKSVLENPAVAKASHNSKYDLVLLAENACGMANLSFDSMLAAYLLGEKSLSLKDIAFSRLGVELLPSSEITGSGAKQIPLFQVNVEEVARFACANVDMVGRLVPLLKNELQAQSGLWELFQNTELPLVSVLAEMEMCGVVLDTALLSQMSADLGTQLDGFQQKIYAQAGEEFNINSPLQLGVVLFEKLHLPGKKVRGKYSTEASILEDLRGFPIVGDILSYRQLMKLKSTYVDALPALVNPRTGRLHTNFNQTRTTTGRLSSSEPNLQNIPVRGELGRQIRGAFISEPGTTLVAGDYSQIDLRVLAHLSQDESLLKAFREDQDIHSATAAQLFGVEMGAVKPDMRRLAKTVNFGVIYGMSEFGLEQATELSREQAGQFIDAYFARYPGVSRYLEKTKMEARQKGYVQTILGHRRYVPEVNSSNRMVREAAERMAINMPVQGTSSDIIKVAMINLQKAVRERKLKSRMLLQVHDELIFEVPQPEMVEMQSLIRDRMSAAISLSVPLKVDIKSGPNWGAME